MIDLKAKHKDRDVWSVPWTTNFRNPNEPYVTLRVTDAVTEATDYREPNRA